MSIPRSTKKPYDLIREGLPAGKHLHHQVCFSFPEDFTEEKLQTVINEFEGLYEKCGGVAAGILSAKMSRNIDNRKGFVLIESVVFESADAFINFHSHEAHASFAEMMAKTADTWIVQDVAINPGDINYT